MALMSEDDVQHFLSYNTTLQAIQWVGAIFPRQATSLCRQFARATIDWMVIRRKSQPGSLWIKPQNTHHRCSKPQQEKALECVFLNSVTTTLTVLANSRLCGPQNQHFPTITLCFAGWGSFFGIMKGRAVF